MRRAPVRTCIGCRTACPAAELLCLIAPAGRVRLAERGPRQAADERDGQRGRGAWVHPRCLERALAEGILVGPIALGEFLIDDDRVESSSPIKTGGSAPQVLSIVLFGEITSLN